MDRKGAERPAPRAPAGRGGPAAGFARAGEERKRFLLEKTVGLVTCAAWPALHDDDRPLLGALEARGVSAVPLVWDDPAVDWAAYRLCVLRSTWDYHLRREEFLTWLDRAGKATRILNPPALVRWNTDKRYLLDLEARGVGVVPTEWLAAGSRADLGKLLGRRGWPSAVLKPVVSADGFKTVRVERSSLPEGQAHLDALLAERDAMIQLYLPSVAGGAHGERCIVAIDGEITHAVRKNTIFEPRPIEASPVPADPDEIEFARRVLGGVSPVPLYARVDVARDGENRVCLMELELAEPTLFLGGAPHALARLADAIARC